MDQETAVWIGCIVGAVVIMLGIGVLLSYKSSDGGWAEWKRRIKEWHDPKVTEVLEMQRGIVLRPGADDRTHSWVHPVTDAHHPVPGPTPYGDKNINDRSEQHLNHGKHFPQQSLNSYSSIITEHSDDTINMHDINGKTIASALDSWTAIEIDRRAMRTFPGAPLHITRNFIREDIEEEARQAKMASYDHCGRLVTSEEAPSVSLYDMSASPSAPSTPSTQRTLQPASPSTASTARTLRHAGQNLAKVNTSSTLASSESASSWTDEATSAAPDIPEKAHVRNDWRAQRQRELYRRMVQKGRSHEQAQDILMGKRSSSEGKHLFPTEASFNADLEA